VKIVYQTAKWSSQQNTILYFPIVVNLPNDTTILPFPLYNPRHTGSSPSYNHLKNNNIEVGYLGSDQTYKHLILFSARENIYNYQSSSSPSSSARKISRRTKNNDKRGEFQTYHSQQPSSSSAQAHSQALPPNSTHPHRHWPARATRQTARPPERPQCFGRASQSQ
jgi:hypothetical protein